MPATVVPEMSAMRNERFVSPLMPASSRACLTAIMPISVVLLTIVSEGSPSCCCISSFDNLTSPTGSSWWQDCR